MYVIVMGKLMGVIWEKGEEIFDRKYRLDDLEIK
jgi:hypothetical protein